MVIERKLHSALKDIGIGQVGGRPDEESWKADVQAWEGEKESKKQKEIDDDAWEERKRKWDESDDKRQKASDDADAKRQKESDAEADRWSAMSRTDKFISKNVGKIQDTQSGDYWIDRQGEKVSTAVIAKAAAVKEKAVAAKAKVSGAAASVKDKAVSFKNLFRLNEKYGADIFKNFFKEEWFILAIIIFLFIKNYRDKKYFFGAICLLLIRMFQGGGEDVMSLENKVIINYKHPGIFIPAFAALGRFIWLYYTFSHLEESTSTTTNKHCDSDVNIYHRRGSVMGDISKMKDVETTVALSYLELAVMGACLVGVYFIRTKYKGAHGDELQMMCILVFFILLLVVIFSPGGVSSIDEKLQWYSENFFNIDLMSTESGYSPVIGGGDMECSLCEKGQKPDPTNKSKCTTCSSDETWYDFETISGKSFPWKSPAKELNQKQPGTLDIPPGKYEIKSLLNNKKKTIRLFKKHLVKKHNIWECSSKDSDNKCSNHGITKKNSQITAIDFNNPIMRSIFKNKGACIPNSLVKTPMTNDSSQAKKLLCNHEPCTSKKAKHILKMAWNLPSKDSPNYYAGQKVHMNTFTVGSQDLHLAFNLESEDSRFSDPRLNNFLCNDSIDGKDPKKCYYNLILGDVTLTDKRTQANAKDSGILTTIDGCTEKDISKCRTGHCGQVPKGEPTHHENNQAYYSSLNDTEYCTLEPDKCKEQKGQGRGWRKGKNPWKKGQGKGKPPPPWVKKAEGIRTECYEPTDKIGVSGNCYLSTYPCMTHSGVPIPLTYNGKEVITSYDSDKGCKEVTLPCNSDGGTCETLEQTSDGRLYFGKGECNNGRCKIKNQQPSKTNHAKNRAWKKVALQGIAHENSNCKRKKTQQSCKAHDNDGPCEWVDRGQRCIPTPTYQYEKLKTIKCVNTPGGKLGTKGGSYKGGTKQPRFFDMDIVPYDPKTESYIINNKSCRGKKKQDDCKDPTCKWDSIHFTCKGAPSTPPDATQAAAEKKRKTEHECINTSGYNPSCRFLKAEQACTTNKECTWTEKIDCSGGACSKLVSGKKTQKSKPYLIDGTIYNYTEFKKAYQSEWCENDEQATLGCSGAQAKGNTYKCGGKSFEIQCSPRWASKKHAPAKNILCGAKETPAVTSDRKSHLYNKLICNRLRSSECKLVKFKGESSFCDITKNKKCSLHIKDDKSKKCRFISLLEPDECLTKVEKKCKEPTCKWKKVKKKGVCVSPNMSELSSCDSTEDCKCQTQGDPIPVGYIATGPKGEKIKRKFNQENKLIKTVECDESKGYKGDAKVLCTNNNKGSGSLLFTGCVHNLEKYQLGKTLSNDTYFGEECFNYCNEHSHLCKGFNVVSKKDKKMGNIDRGCSLFSNPCEKKHCIYRK